MQDHWTTARNHYLAMAALAMALGGLISLVDPAIASAVALPAAFFSAQPAGARFARLSARAMTRGEALRLAMIAAALPIAAFIIGIGVVMATDPQPVTDVHYGNILGIILVTVLVMVPVTLAGLWFGARMVLSRQAKG
jgi:hypothetical protein